MLVNWTIENFKSIGSELTLFLSPVTVLVGANSSGKSSIIQSILLIKQTLQYATADRPIALNGPLLKLGNFTDVKNVIAKGEGFRIGWRYDSGQFALIFPNLGKHLDIRLSKYAPYRTEVSKIECSTQFGLESSSNRSELSLLQPLLISSKLSVTAKDVEGQHNAYIKAERSREPEDEALIRQLRPLPYAVRAKDIPYQISELDDETRTAVLEDHPKGEIIGAGVRHFFPFGIMVKYDIAIRRATQIAESICGLRKTVRFQREYGNLAAPQSLLPIIDEWLKSNADFFKSQPSPIEAMTPTSTFLDIVDLLQNFQRKHRFQQRGIVHFSR